MLCSQIIFGEWLIGTHEQVTYGMESSGEPVKDIGSWIRCTLGLIKQGVVLGAYVNVKKYLPPQKCGHNSLINVNWGILTNSKVNWEEQKSPTISVFHLIVCWYFLWLFRNTHVVRNGKQAFSALVETNQLDMELKSSIYISLISCLPT